MEHPRKAGQGDAPRPSDLSELRGLVESLAESGSIDIVAIGASDFNGIFRGKYLPLERFLGSLDNPTSIGDLVFAFDPAEGVTMEGPAVGWWPISERGLRELECISRPETFRVIPWRDRAAICLCDFRFSRGGETLDAAPHAVLDRVVERAGMMGFEARVGYELEFFVYHDSTEVLREKGFRELQPVARRAQGWSIMRGGLAEPALRPLRENLEAFGIPIEAWTVEGASGQFEINIPYSVATEAADRAFLHRFAIKEVAEANGYVATFMARPPESKYGSSLHLHVSLWSREENRFFDDHSPDALTDVARHFIAGQLEHQYELTATLAPNINSYKRLLPGFSSGINATWGFENWSVGCRVISTSHDTTRVEQRTAGADANPYLAIAAVLAAGLSGIDKSLEPPPPTRGLGDEDPNARRVPGSLAEAIPALEASGVAKDYLGEEFVRVYCATRRAELKAFQESVTDWEARRYLEPI